MSDEKSGEFRYRVVVSGEVKASDGNYGSEAIFSSAAIGFDDPDAVTDDDINLAVSVGERLGAALGESLRKKAFILRSKMPGGKK